MKGLAVIATALSALSASVSALPIDLNPDMGTPGIIDPLAIFVQLPGTKIATVTFTDNSNYSSKGPRSTVVVTATSTLGVTSAPTTSTQQDSTSAPPPSSTSAAPAPSSSSAYTAPSPSSEPEKQQPAQSNGQIPDGQGNNFNTPSGAIRFPWNHNNADNVVPITPSSDNGGWAMSPNQKCTPGSWCPYACAPGYYSAQWDPNATAYNGKGSMNGGLYADSNGKLTKPFPDRPFCSPGMFNAVIENKLGQSVSACQTVYPGNEAMIIPTVAQAGGSVQLNVVPSTYWLGTSSQFYVNLAGSDASKCVWGDDTSPVGNWAPYIFGAGQAKDGNTYVSVQFNPLYTSMGFKTSAAYNVRIECTDGQCNFPKGGECRCEGGKCSVDNGCTVTLPQNAKAKFVLY